MKHLLTLILATFLFSNSGFAGGDSAGGGFVFSPSQIKNSDEGSGSGGFVFGGQQVKHMPDQEDIFESNHLHLAGSESGGSGFIIEQASLEVSQGRVDIAEAVLRNYRPELTSFFNEIRHLNDNSSLSRMKSPIHQSIKATILNNYGGYDEEEAIEAVIKAPEKVDTEVRQIIYSI